MAHLLAFGRHGLTGGDILVFDKLFEPNFCFIFLVIFFDFIFNFVLFILRISFSGFALLSLLISSRLISQDSSSIPQNLFAISILKDLFAFKFFWLNGAFLTLDITAFQVSSGVQVVSILTSISSSNVGLLRVEDLETDLVDKGRPGI